MVVGAVVVVKLVILSVLPLTSFMLAFRAAFISLLNSFTLALRVVLVAKLVISGILSSIFLILALYASF